MKSVIANRRQDRQEAGKVPAINAFYERVWAVQVRAYGAESGILPLPCTGSSLTIDDPASADYGKYVFVAGISLLGGDDVIVP